jgi:hypothetical protein
MNPWVRVASGAQSWAEDLKIYCRLAARLGRIRAIASNNH